MKTLARVRIDAEWRKLIMANYTVDPAILAPYVPYGTSIDLFAGECYVSLVGFMFLKSRFNGIPIPFHASFEEVNLRFYVMRDEGDVHKRGVVFLRELVPKPAVTFVANQLFQEHYQTCRMDHHWSVQHDIQQVHYKWKYHNWHSFDIKAGTTASPLVPGSKEEFFTEHYWGYTQIHPGKTLEYFVNHVAWETYETKAYMIDVDFGVNYGASFSFLNKRIPESVFLSEGSSIYLEKSKAILKST